MTTGMSVLGKRSISRGEALLDQNADFYRLTLLVRIGCGSQMPIKFNCGCGHVLTVPDSAAGKSGKCPKCQKTVKVPELKAPVQKSPTPTKASTAAANPAAANPAASAKATAAGKTATAMQSAAKQPADAVSANLMDSLFDDVGLKKQTGPMCPKCSMPIRPGAVVCTSCGLNFESGEQISGFDAKSTRPEFENPFLQEASNNMVRDMAMDLRRDRASMPWWVIMSFLIGAITLCAAGVVIVDGKFGAPAEESTFIGRVQRLPVFTVLGLTACITGLAITTFAHLSITFFGFTKSVVQGLACFFLPLIYSIIYGIMNWGENKAPVKAIITAMMFIGFGVFLIIQGGGFGLLRNVF